MFDDGYTRRLANSARLLGLTIRCPDCETATIASTGDALYDTHSKRWCVGFYCHDCRTKVPAFHLDWEQRIEEAVGALDPASLPPAIGY